MNSVQEILSLIPATGAIAGRDLRAAFNKGKWWWQRYSGTGFYRLMCEMEDAGLVSTCFEDRVVDGEAVRPKLFSRR